MSKISVAGAGWCRYTRRAIQDINANTSIRNRFELLNCSPEKGRSDDGFEARDDSNHPACKELKKQKLGFPTFMNCDGDSCNVVFEGYTENLQNDVLDKV